MGLDTKFDVTSEQTKFCFLEINFERDAIGINQRHTLQKPQWNGDKNRTHTNNKPRYTEPYLIHKKVQT